MYIEKIYLENINKRDIQIVFDLGSYNLLNVFKLMIYYDKSIIHCFECNPECIKECQENLSLIKDYYKDRIIFNTKAITENNQKHTFYPFNVELYNNPAASSMFKIDFSMRNIHDPDYNRPNPQKEIMVEGIRLDYYLQEKNINNIDLLCIDLQGYEIKALLSLGDLINTVKYILVKTSIQSTYINGANFLELESYLNNYSFKYCCSRMFGYNKPDLKLTGYSEFDALFIKS